MCSRSVGAYVLLLFDEPYSALGAFDSFVNLPRVAVMCPRVMPPGT